MRGLYRLNRLIFMMFSHGERKRRHKLRPLPEEGQAKVQKFMQRYEELRHAKDTNPKPDPVVRRHHTADRRPGVLLQSQIHRPVAARHDHPAGNGGSTPVIEHNESWASLEEKLLQMVKDNPDTKEVDLNEPPTST